MSYKTVFVANAKTKEADSWLLTGEMKAIYQGKKETICLLKKGVRSCALPKRCVFESKEAALAALGSDE